MLRNQKQTKLNNKGFSLVELLVAVAILGMIAVTIALFMGSSSRTYSKENADATIQAEAQVVANAISDRIIDCDDRVNYSPGLAVSVNGIPTNESAEDSSKPRFGDENGNVLEIANKLQKEMILLDRDEQKVYYMSTERVGMNKAFPKYDFSKAELLAEHVSDFKVNTDRFDKEYIIWFELTYEKEQKRYTGTYQVNVRNHIMINEADKIDPVSTNRVTGLVLSPEEYYINIKGNTVCNDLGSEITDIKYTCAYRPFNAKDVNPVWSLLPEDDIGCSLENGADGTLHAKLICSGDVSQYNTKHFRVIAKHTNNADDVVEGTATVYVRKITSVSISPSDGIYIDPEDGTEYALPGSTVVLDAAVEGWYLDGNKYQDVKWNVFCNNSSCCSADNKAKGIDCSSLVVSKLGKKISIRFNEALNKVYTVTATSTWDDTKYATYTIPVKVKDYTYKPLIRGANISLNSYLALQGGDSGYKCYYPKSAEIYQVELANGANLDGSAADFAKLVKPDYTVYVDHNPSNLHYYDHRKIGFYGALTLKIRVSGPFVNMNGEEKQSNDIVSMKFPAVSVHKTTNESCDAAKKWSRTAIEDRNRVEAVYNMLSEADKKIILNAYANPNNAPAVNSAKQVMEKLANTLEKDITANTEAEKTEKEAKIYAAQHLLSLLPEEQLIAAMNINDTKDTSVVVRKGYSTALHIFTRGYNIVDSKYIGVYADCSETSKGNNINGQGSNSYLSAAITSTLGTKEDAEDNAIITLNAFNDKIQSKYPVDPIIVRAGIDHFYNCFTAKELSDGGEKEKVSIKNSYTEYKVYVANVEGTDKFVPTPDSKDFPSDVKSLSVNGSLTKTVGPNNISVTYKKLEGDKYTIQYNNNTYVYNKANRFWREQ